MAWNDRRPWLGYMQRGETRGNHKAADSLQKAIIVRIDEKASAKLLAASVEFEDALLEGVTVEEGEGTVAQVLAKAYEHAMELESGYVAAVLYSSEGYEVRIRVDAGGRRVEVAVIAGGRGLSGLEALRLYRNLKGEYSIVAVEA